MTEEASEQGRDAGGMRSRRMLPLVARVVGYLIVPLYVAGICATILLERAAGLREEAGLIANIENALLNISFTSALDPISPNTSACPIGVDLLRSGLPR